MQQGGPPMDGPTQLLDKKNELFLEIQIRPKYSLVSGNLKKSSVFSSHHQLSSLCLTIHKLLSQSTQSLGGVHEEDKHPLHGI
jgi:hypothetical protein